MRTKNLTRVAAAVMLTASTLLATAPVARAVLAPEQQCAKSRYDAKAKYDQCQAKALGLHFAKNDPAKLHPALSKCRVNYTATYVKLQKKAAGLCNWRLPAVAELRTVLSEEFPCTTSPCIDPVFGPTIANDDYWSSTTLADNTTYAWGVFFGTGEVSYGLKSTTNSVRAVRGGL